MNTSSSLEVLVTFAISFYDTPHLQQVMPILLTYCRESLEYSSDVMCFFEEMFTLFEETPTLQALMQSFSAEYLKILIVECCVSDADDEVVATRSKLRSGLCSVKEMCNDYFNILTTALLQYKDNPRVIESVCFLWEAVDTLPSQLSHISIHRP
ncbi:hypothetical protein EIN_275010 [Entamoeba invadens IP1]|uniref:Uncharacterized protein n=1 Tax=Entamoeba invadens IP1 TaxID=370355 RepID=A0A0A1U1J8_ENTIV|nr:hypothetical protein EIN_275010 [Entamoeba invadens IP1]ELP87914.1 hypothetical protein EIN_275010 [Entamoeba invadens IP1]|eukprot:XP_004254685.1 hypothetical protein EIN_275010 [Entamoeba invadens IP1]